MPIVTAALLLALPVAGQERPRDPDPSWTSGQSGPIAKAAAKTAKYTLDTPVEAIVADPKAKAVLEADVPGVSTHPSYEMFKSMSLKQLQGYAPDKLTDAVLARTATDLAAIK